MTCAGLLGAQEQRRAARISSRNSSQVGTAAGERTARPRAPYPQLLLSGFLQSCIQRPTTQKSGQKERITRARLAPLETFVRDANESMPTLMCPRPAAEDRPGVPRDFLQVHVHPGAVRRAQRARTLRESLAVGRARDPAAQGARGATVLATGVRGRSEGIGTLRATGLALPRLRMQRLLGTDAPRARCMLMAGGRAMNYSAAARRGRARHGGRPGPRVPRRCRAAAPTSQTFPGQHRGCGPRCTAVPARARWPRFPRCRLFYVFCLGVGTCPRERVSLPTPSPPDRGGGGGTGDREGGDRESKAPACPASWGDRPGAAAAAVPEHPGTPAPRGGQGCERARNTNAAAVPAADQCVRAPPLPGTPLPGRARSGWAGGGSCGFSAPARPCSWPRSSACAPPRARRPGRSPPARSRPAAPPVALAHPPHWAPHGGDPPVEPRGQRSGEG